MKKIALFILATFLFAGIVYAGGGTYDAGDYNFPNRIAIGSTTPSAVLSIQASAGTSSLAVGSSTASYLILDAVGHMLFGGTSPTISNCGTNPALVRGNDSAGLIKIGTGAVNTCTLTFRGIWNAAPQCFININSPAATSTVAVASSTPSTFVVNASASNIGGSFIGYRCVGTLN